MMKSACLILLLLCLSEIVSAARGGTNNKDACKAVKHCTKLLSRGKRCALIPVPKKSFLTPVAPQPFRLTLLRSNVWLYEDGAYLILILRLGGHLAVLDLPDSPGSNKPDGSQTHLTDAAEEILNGTVPTRIDVVYSHAHFDHIGGATRFYNYFREKHPRAQIFVWGSQESKLLVEKSISKRAVIPNVIVDDGGRTLSLAEELHVKMMINSGHTAEDLLLYIPRCKEEPPILMFVDVVYPGWSPPSGLASTLNVGKYIESQRALLRLDFDIFIGGHGKVGTRRDVQKNLEFSEDLVDAARQATAAVTEEELIRAGIGKFTQPDAVEYGNIWFTIIGVLQKLEIDECYRIMWPKWGCKLAGLDFTLRGNCFAALSYVRTDL